MYDFYYVTYECILPIGICIVLPIIVVGLISYTRIRRDNARRDIVLHALDKNAEIDVEELVRKMNRYDKLLKEKLLRKLLFGSVFVIFGLLVYISMVMYMCLDSKMFVGTMFVEFSFVAIPALAIGVAFLMNYYVGKKMLANEIEAEERAKVSGKA